MYTYCSHSERLQVGFSFGLLLISFFPSTGILFRVGFVVAERLDEQQSHDVILSLLQSTVSTKSWILFASLHRMQKTTLCSTKSKLYTYVLAYINLMCIILAVPKATL